MNELEKQSVLILSEIRELVGDKDKQKWHQVVMQLHDKKVISTRTLAQEMNLDYDETKRCLAEIKKRHLEK